MSTLDKPVEEMTRAELEDTVEELQTELGELKNGQESNRKLLQFLQDILLGDLQYDPDYLEEQLGEQGLLELLLDGGSVGTETVDIRAMARDIHVDWIDLREGRDGDLKQNKKRGAVLFSRFIRRACGEQNVGVEKTHGKLRMTGDRAKQLLKASEHVSMPASGASKTIKRAMTFVQEGSKADDCGCSDFDRCRHGLVVFNRDDGYALTADVDAFSQYLHDVEDVVESDVDPADDATAADGSRGPGTDDDSLVESVDDELDELASATSEEEFADTVVSSSNGRLSAATDHRSGKTSDSQH